MTKRQMEILRGLFERRETGLAGRSRLTTPRKDENLKPLFRGGYLTWEGPLLLLTNNAFKIAIANGWTPPIDGATP